MRAPLGLCCAALCLAPLAALGGDTCGAAGRADCQEAARGNGSAALNWDAFEENGYIVVPGVLTEDQVSRAKRAFRRSEDAMHGASQFRQEGSLVELDPVFVEFIEFLPPEVEAKMNSILGPWIVGGYAQITLRPLPPEAQPKGVGGMRVAKSFGLHSDFPYGHSGKHWGCGDECLEVVPPQYPRTLQLIFMLDDFTQENGGTLLLPGSHKDRVLPSGQAARKRFGIEARNAVGKAGDLIMYVGFMWHSSGVNVASKERAAVILQCLPYFFKPMHSHAYRLPNRVAKQLSRKMQNRLGLTGYSWFKHTGQLGGGWPQPLRHASILLSDALLYGYPTRYKAEIGRLYALIALFGPMCCACCCGSRTCCGYSCCGRQPCAFTCWRCRGAVHFSLTVGLGMLLGVCLTLEKFQM